MPDALAVPPCLRLALEFRTRAEIVLPELAGSALRGMLGAGLRRLDWLRRHWGLGRPDLGTRAPATRRVVLFDPETREWRAQRGSSRQRQRIPLAGLLGRFALDLAAAPELLPALAWAPVFGVGRSVTIGVGQVRVVPGRQACPP